ncbi:L10-interacting MYB domain-containing protein [Senna tora]|uniref:L10-interacting MYB domain-containing protein n=1 Tax=Senna tora TaxID=362788 RepID=A0A834TKC6_9FABA|nr:L10-interacting MYB domain-containing protein [Senna tora]
MVPNLRSVNLRNTENMMMMMPDFRRMPNLERLSLEGSRTKASKAKTNARLAKKKRANNTEPASSNSIAKCVDDLDKIDGVSNNSSMKALEKFQDPYWREVFLTMPCDRKKAWLDSLVLDWKVIHAIAEEAIIKVRNKLARPVDDNLVGMQSRVEALENLLDLGSHNIVRVVGICGMVGVGKTTLGISASGNSDGRAKDIGR